ncbi:MAG TPA: FHA domain-containing protein [Solidesulfovibrio sp.]|nr:hypothetical protein [Desulfovibrio sp.]HML59818.1 FHA domain-containing protein [Solidesulfovibrio sp.]
MTSPKDDQTIIRPLAALTLTVRDPSGRVRQVPLAQGELTLGRDAANGLPLDPADSSASRRHASLAVDGATLTVTDLGSTNGVFVNAVRVDRAVLAPGDEVRVGRTVLVVEAAGATPMPPPEPPSQREKALRGLGRALPAPRHLLVLCALGVLLLFVGLLLFSRPQSPPPDAPEAAPQGQAPLPDAPPQPDKPAPTPEAVAKAQDLSRQGMFFYNNKQIVLAISEWEKAMALDPQNAQTAKWLARAEAERDQLIDKYYREGAAALKYARLDEAKTSFRFVTEYCRSHSADERCQDAAKQLGQLEGNTP